MNDAKSAIGNYIHYTYSNYKKYGLLPERTTSQNGKKSQENLPIQDVVGLQSAAYKVQKKELDNRIKKLKLSAQEKKTLQEMQSLAQELSDNKLNLFNNILKNNGINKTFDEVIDILLKDIEGRITNPNLIQQYILSNKFVPTSLKSQNKIKQKNLNSSVNLDNYFVLISSLRNRIYKYTGDKNKKSTRKNIQIDTLIKIRKEIKDITKAHVNAINSSNLNSQSKQEIFNLLKDSYRNISKQFKELDLRTLQQNNVKQIENKYSRGGNNKNTNISNNIMLAILDYLNIVTCSDTIAAFNGLFERGLGALLGLFAQKHINKNIKFSLEEIKKSITSALSENQTTVELQSNLEDNSVIDSRIKAQFKNVFENNPNLKAKYDAQSYETNDKANIELTCSIKKATGISVKAYRTTKHDITLQKINLGLNILSWDTKFANHWLNMTFTHEPDTDNLSYIELIKQHWAYEALSHGNMLKDSANNHEASALIFFDLVKGVMYYFEAYQLLQNISNFDYKIPNFSSVINKWYGNEEYSMEEAYYRIAELIIQLRTLQIGVKLKASILNTSV